MHSPFTVLVNFIIFKQWLWHSINNSIGMYINKSEYQCLWPKEIAVDNFPILPVIIYYEY